MGLANHAIQVQNVVIIIDCAVVQTTFSGLADWANQSVDRPLVGCLTLGVSHMCLTCVSHM